MAHTNFSNEHSEEAINRYLRSCEEKANNQLQRDGYIFLHDIYKIIRGNKSSEEEQYVRYHVWLAQ